MFEQSLMSKSFEWFKYFNALQCVRGLHVLNVPNSIFNLDVPTSLFHTKRWQLHLNVSHLITKMSNFKLILTVRYNFDICCPISISIFTIQHQSWYSLSNINFDIRYPISILVFVVQYQFQYSLSNINSDICCPVSILIFTIQSQLRYSLPIPISQRPMQILISTFSYCPFWNVHNIIQDFFSIQRLTKKTNKFY